MIPNDSIPKFILKMRISEGMPKIELKGYFYKLLKMIKSGTIIVYPFA